LGHMVPDRPVTIGKPLPTYSIVILDPEHGEALAWGDAGEIGIAGIGVAEGYLNRRSLTEAKFIPDFLDLPNNRSKRIYRTGDLGRLTQQGEIEYLGRIDTQVKLRGYRIELTEIESVLLELDEIAQVVAATFEPTPGATELVAYYSVKHGSGAPAADAISAVLRERLPAYMIPAYLERLPFIPTLVSNKADRSKLPAPKSPRLRLNERRAAPETATERLLCRALKETLACGEVSIDADFFNDYGAHSLLMARFCAKIRKLSPLTPVAMRDIYTNPTVRKLARALQQTQPPGAAVRDYADALRPSRLAYVACGAAQAAVYILSLVASIEASLSALAWTSEVTGAPALLALRCLAMAGAAFLGLNILAIAGKWALIGAGRDETIAIWSFAYFRFWLAKYLIGLAPARAFPGTPIYNLFLMALGARIGRHAVVKSLAVPVAAHRFVVGDNAVVCARATMQGYSAVGNRLMFGDVRIGRYAYVGEASVLDIDTAIGDFSQLGHASSLQAGQRIPDGKRFHGSPAEETTSRFRLDDELPVPKLRRMLGPALQLFNAGCLSALGGAVGTYAADVLAGRPQHSRGNLSAVALALIPTAAWISLVLLLGSLVAGLCIVAIVPRMANRFLKPGKIYPLFGFHHALQRVIESVSNSPFFNLLFGDSFAIGHYLRLSGWRFGDAASTSSKFGALQTHDNPLLCFIGNGVVASDGLHLGNVTQSSQAFRLSECRIGAGSFLGTNVFVPPGARMGDNCLYATKVMAPIDGAIRQNIGLLGSPAFEIPRRTARDDEALAKIDPFERQRQTARKARHNIVSQLLLLGAMWCVEFMSIYAVSFAFAFRGAFDVLWFSAVFAVAAVCNVSFLLFVERASLGFSTLQPQFTTTYDPAYWRVERFWKLSFNWAGGLFFGTPFRSWILRAMGVKVGRMAFDDGCTISEPTLVELGDAVNLNAYSALQGHSLEDGVFKSDMIRVGANVSVGVAALVHYDVALHACAVVDADSFVMKGEVAPAGSRWRGNPARMIGAEAQKALAA
jgi:non-ribosomal peptide synthetase-like protein